MAQASKMQIAFKWGGIMGIALIVSSLLFYLMGASEPSSPGSIISTILSYIISIGTLVMGIKAYKLSNGNNLTLGDGIVLGILIAIVGGIIMAIYTYIFLVYIDTSILETIKDQSLSQASTENMDADQAEMVENFMGVLTSPTTMSVSIIVMKIFLGLFVGLTSGLIMKNTKEEYPDLT